jgi:Nucleotidyltransferase
MEHCAARRLVAVGCGGGRQAVRSLRPVTGARRVEAIVRDTPWLMDALRAGREVDAPDCSTAETRSGLRSTGSKNATSTSAMSLGSPKPCGRSQTAVRTAPARIAQPCPLVPGEVRLRGAAARLDRGLDRHLARDRDLRRRSSRGRDSITVLAPLGTDDLLGMIHRRNPARVSEEEYERRLRTKRISDGWPRVRIKARDQAARVRSRPEAR